MPQLDLPILHGSLELDTSVSGTQSPKATDGTSNNGHLCGQLDKVTRLTGSVPDLTPFMIFILKCWYRKRRSSSISFSETLIPS